MPLEGKDLEAFLREPHLAHLSISVATGSPG
jgi:hypothetical protein